MSLVKIPRCNYCTQLADLVDGLAIYPHRPDLAHLPFWLCKPCSAYVGCHPGSQRPLGRLANAELRIWKQRAHKAFDHLWKSGWRSRKQAYALLSELLGIPIEETHIGMFDLYLCKRVVELCDNKLRSKP